jgi:hypothetical protein
MILINAQVVDGYGVLCPGRRVPNNQLAPLCVEPRFKKPRAVR